MSDELSSMKNPGQSNVVFLPMIDSCASDDSCEFSTLLFLAEQAISYEFSPIVTFDQPLYWKGIMIIAYSDSDSSKPIKKIVLKLCGFNTIMNFAGCIGHIMEGLGIEELLNLVNATNTVPYMLSCKEISRAIRAISCWKVL